jgi:hypothetical protein
MPQDKRYIPFNIYGIYFRDWLLIKSRIMKRIVIATSISLFLISCKKDGGGNDQQKTTLLSEISSNSLKARG